MPVSVESTRFGHLEVSEAAVLEFPAGLIGLGGSRWTLVADSPDSAFRWLHSLDDPSLAVPVTSPWLFFSDYEVALSEADTERVGVSDPRETEVYVTVRTGEALESFAANLRAPIVIAGGRGHQVINEADAPVRAPLFSAQAAESVA